MEFLHLFSQLMAMKGGINQLSHSVNQNRVKSLRKNGMK